MVPLCAMLLGKPAAVPRSGAAGRQVCALEVWGFGGSTAGK